LADLYLQKQKSAVNPAVHFDQGLVHKDYLNHLYELFRVYCSVVLRIKTKISNRSPDKRTGKKYSRIRFHTYSLPCFVEFFNLFYSEGKKIVPANIGDLLTASGLAYWICDDGSFDKINSCIVLSTESYKLDEVKLLQGVLVNKFKIKCTINKSKDHFRIRISKESVPALQALLKDIMPPMMLHKIGL